MRLLRKVRTRIGARAMAMTREGKVRWITVSKPPLPGPAMGSNFHFTPRRKASMRPDQKIGMPSAMVKATRTVWSGKAPRRTAERRAKGTAMMKAMRIE